MVLERTNENSLNHVTILCTSRFQPPVSPDPWNKTLNATQFGWACPQIYNFHNDTGRDKQNEDCLTLNVYTPYQVGDISK